jgi:rhomboid protease GluP
MDELRCPYCGLASPGSWWKSNPWTQALKNPEQVMRIMIYVNVAMFLVSLLFNPRSAGFSINPFQLLSPSNHSLLLLGATGTYPIDSFGRWWTLLSANYLHGGVLHILFNMMAFRQIAPLVIQEYGAYRMIVLYTASGVLGYGVSYLAGVPLTIGASAAVCGLIGAVLYFSKNWGGSYGQAVYRQVGGWVVGLFIFGFLMPGINNWAHGGGLLGGALLGFWMGYQEQKREAYIHKALAGVCAAATVAALFWALASGVYYRMAG